MFWPNFKTDPSIEFFLNSFLNLSKLSITRVFHDKEIWCISVRLSDRSKVTQNKINSIKNFPQWGLNPWPPDHHFNALPTEPGRDLLDRRQTTKQWLSSVGRALEWWSGGCGFKPHWGKVLTKVIRLIKTVVRIKPGTHRANLTQKIQKIKHD